MEVACHPSGWQATEERMAETKPATEPRTPAAERRETLAGMAMQGLLARDAPNPPAGTVGHWGGTEAITYAERIANDAVMHADALIIALARPVDPFK
jgi:DMSO/TMAO reductase YedYZ molybdopterin-dependent catalytic subunit